MSELTQDLIQQALDQDFNKANNTFGDIMSVKLTDLLDQEKIKLADQTYNGVEDDDDSQLDFDFDSEDDSGTDEGADAEDSEEDELDFETEIGDESEEDEE
jgi:hypothetical protein